MFDKHVHHLRNIGTMQVIMVGYLRIVPFLYRAQEIDQLVVLYDSCRCRDFLQVLHDLVNGHRKSVLSRELSAQFQAIEVKRIDLCQLSLVLLKLRSYFVHICTARDERSTWFSCWQFCYHWDTFGNTRNKIILLFLQIEARIILEPLCLLSRIANYHALVSATSNRFSSNCR